MAKSIIDIYQLPVPDLILSIQTSDININNQIQDKFDIPVETKYAIQDGIATTAKITSENIEQTFIDLDYSYFQLFRCMDHDKWYQSWYEQSCRTSVAQ